MTADKTEDEIRLNDEVMGVILPGGMPGTTNLEKSEKVQKAIDFCVENNRLVAAICAAPSILGHKNLLYGLDATCYPGVEGECYGANIRKQRPVCCAKNFITGMSAGCATQFAAKSSNISRGETVAQNVLFRRCMEGLRDKKELRRTFLEKRRHIDPKINEHLDKKLPKTFLKVKFSNLPTRF